MAIYTVHAPPLRGEEALPDPERFVFVRDGFSFWAFVLTPFWMLWRGLWIVFILYLVAMLVVQIGLYVIHATQPVQAAAGILFSLLIGFEAATLRRWTLNLRGWTQLGVVSGDHLETAERRFFDSWLKQVAWQTAQPPAPAAPPQAGLLHATSDVVGVFADPQARQ